MRTEGHGIHAEGHDYMPCVHCEEAPAWGEVVRVGARRWGDLAHPHTPGEGVAQGSARGEAAASHRAERWARSSP
eukprot:scaffold118551_cov57-Phaeocystis_antarctica.AAC.1